ncbi:DUF2924 domain-containing protein [bacterium]|nr:DUF2924 domain-containing protein [bacterium]
MKQETLEELQRLHTMTIGELKSRYAEVFGEESRSNNKPYLLKKIAWRLQSLDEGGLSERAKRRAEELANDADIRLRPPKSTTVKTDSAVIEPVSFKTKTRKDGLHPGMILKRVYKNQSLLVTVAEEGFLFNGTIYRSLSAIAKEVTGSIWNGKLFF